MTASTRPMTVGTIFALIILTGVVVGALTGIARSEFGGPAWLAGGAAGALAGVIAQVLFRRRTRALRDRP